MCYLQSYDGSFFEVYSLENKQRAVSWGEKYSVHSVAWLTQTVIDSTPEWLPLLPSSQQRLWSHFREKNKKHFLSVRMTTENFQKLTWRCLKWQSFFFSALWLAVPCCSKAGSMSLRTRAAVFSEDTRCGSPAGLGQPASPPCTRCYSVLLRLWPSAAEVGRILQIC